MTEHERHKTQFAPCAIRRGRPPCLPVRCGCEKRERTGALPYENFAEYCPGIDGRTGIPASSRTDRNVVGNSVFAGANRFIGRPTDFVVDGGNFAVRARLFAFGLRNFAVLSRNSAVRITERAVIARTFAVVKRIFAVHHTIFADRHTIFAVRHTIFKIPGEKAKIEAKTLNFLPKESK